MTKSALSEFTRVYNMMTRRHVLELQKTYPTLKVMYQVHFDGVREPEGVWRRPPARLGRIPDGGLMGDILRFVEVKTTGEILRSVPVGLRQVYTEFLKSSTLGQQIANEKAILKWSGKHGVALEFTAQDPVTLRSFEFEVPVGDVGISVVQSYMNMGDGIEASRLFHPPKPPRKGDPTSSARAGSTPETTARPPAVPEVQKQRAEENTRATAERGTEARGTSDARPGPTWKVEEAPGQRREAGRTAPELARGATAVDPGHSFERMHEQTSGFEGAAMLLYDRQIENLYAAEWSKAVSAVENSALQNSIFTARQSGQWVLVRVNFLVTDAPDAGGNRRIMFWNTSVSAASPPSEDVDVAFMREKLRNTRMPAVMSAGSSGGDQATFRNVPSGWSVRSEEYSIIKGFPQGRARIGYDDPVNWHDGIRGTMGRCHEDRGF